MAATKHKIAVDEEQLMDVVPINVSDLGSDTLAPADKAIESGLEGDTQMFFKEFLKTGLLSADDMMKVQKVRGNVPL